MAKTTKMRIYQTHQTRHSMIGSQDMIVLAAFGRYGTKTLQNCYFGQKRPYFGHFGCQHFFYQNFISWSSKSYGDTTSIKRLEKIFNGKGCRTGQMYIPYRPKTHHSELNYCGFPKAIDYSREVNYCAFPKEYH